MSKAERLKEEIGVLKLFATAFLAVDVSLIAWLAQNHQKAETAVVLGGTAAIAITTAALFVMAHRIHKRLKDLEKC